MKICYLCLQVTHEGQASHAHVHEIINGLKLCGCRVDLYEPHYDNKSETPSGLERCTLFMKLQMKIWRSNEKYDIIYIRSHFAAIPTSIWARIKNIPTVLEINGPITDLYLAWPWTRHFKLMFRWMWLYQIKNAKTIITVTHLLKKQIIEATNHKYIYTIPNGANSKKFVPKRDNIAPIVQPYVMFFGAMAPWQGIDTILDAVSDLNWPENVKLVFAGDGTERWKVERAATKNNRIKYIGNVKYEDMANYISHSLAGLSIQNNAGGRSETGLYPLKVFETMSCGVPIIVSDWPGQSDIVRENNCGIVIPYDQPSILAKAVAMLYANPEIAAEYGANGREAIKREHSWENRSRQTYNVIKDTIKRNK